MQWVGGEFTGPRARYSGGVGPMAGRKVAVPTIVSPHRASPCPVSPGYPWPPPGAVSTSCTSSVAEPGPEDEDTHAAPARPRHRRQPRPGRGRDRGHHQGEAPRREGGRRHGPVLLRLQGGPLRQAASQGT